MPAEAKATLTQEGRLTIASGTSDIGTGTYTALAIFAARFLAFLWSALKSSWPTQNFPPRHSRVAPGRSPLSAPQ